MKSHLLTLVLAASLGLSGCNVYYADQATKRGVRAYEAAKEARKHGDAQKANMYYRQAQQEFETAAYNDSTAPDRHYNVGRVCQDLKQYDRAIESYDSAIRYLPGYYKAHWGTVYCLVKGRAPQEQVDEAVTRAVGIVEPSRVYLTLAMSYYHVGRRDDMPVVLNKAARAGAMDAYVQAVVGRFYRAIGDKPMAIKHLAIAYELNPNQPGVARDLGALGQGLPPTPMLGSK